MQKTKRCPKCKNIKSISEFGKEETRKDGFRCWCCSCDNKRNRKHYQEHKEEYRKRQKTWECNNPKNIAKRCRKHRIKKVFGLSVKEYDDLKCKLLLEQNGRCKVCGRHESELTQKLQLDHNHETKQIRGLLCIRCNTRLAYFEDIEFVTNAKVYLSEYNIIQ